MEQNPSVMIDNEHGGPSLEYIVLIGPLTVVNQQYGPLSDLICSLTRERLDGCFII